MDKERTVEAIAAPRTPQQAQEEGQKHERALVRGRAWLLFSAALLVIFGALTAVVLTLRPLEFDLPLSHAIQSIDWPPWDALMVAVSWPGFSPWSLIIPAVVVGALTLFRRIAEALFLALATAGTAAQEGVKALVHRARPTADQVHIELVHRLDSSSFPSGHVTEYTLVCGFCFYLAWTLMRPGPLRTCLLVLNGALILLVGPSRVWLGEHWTSDALGGYTLGFGLLLLVIWAYRGWEARKLTHQTPLPPPDQPAIMSPTAQK